MKSGIYSQKTIMRRNNHPEVETIVYRGSCGRGFGAFSEFHLLDDWEKTGITDRRRRSEMY
jgi:hypothetical protein